MRMRSLPNLRQIRYHARLCPKIASAKATRAHLGGGGPGARLGSEVQRHACIVARIEGLLTDLEVPVCEELNWDAVQQDACFIWRLYLLLCCCIGHGWSLWVAPKSSYRHFG